MQSAVGATGTSASSDFEERTYRKVTLRIVPFLFICYLAAYLDRVNVSFAKLQMKSELGFSDAVYGFGAGIFFVAYVLCEVPSNIIMLKVGARIWIARIMITWGIISALMVFVRTPMTFYILRFLLGAAEAGFIPGILLYLTYWFPAARRGKITALFLTAIPFAAIIGGPLSGLILSTVGAGGAGSLSGWQWLFLIETIPSIVLGVVCIVYLRDSVAKVSWLDEEEKRLVSDTIAREEHAKEDHSHLMQAFSDGRVWLLGVIYFAIASGIYIISFWLPTLIKATGVDDPLKIGLLAAVPYIAAIVAMVAVTASADRQRERRWHTLVPAVAAGLGLIFVAAVGKDNLLLTMIGLTVAAAGTSSAQASFWCLPAAFLGGAAAAAGIALVNSLGNVGGFVSSNVPGWLDSTLTLCLCGAILMVGGAFILAVPARLVNK